jgi:hypothetical protein
MAPASLFSARAMGSMSGQLSRKLSWAVSAVQSLRSLPDWRRAS